VKTSISPHHVVLSLCTALTSLSVLATTNSAQAVTVQFNDLASFTAATTTQNIDFEGTAGATGVTFYDSSGLSINGVTFASLVLLAVDPALVNTEPNLGSGTTIRTCVNCTISATLPSGITAVGSEILDYNLGSVPFLITLSTGETFNINSLNFPDRQFVGFTSDTDIDSISFQATGGGTNSTRLDNFRFGTANATSVPEPFTVIGTLIGGTAAFRMRKQLKSARK
jgi:hypothetical protein